MLGNLPVHRSARPAQWRKMTVLSLLQVIEIVRTPPRPSPSMQNWQQNPPPPRLGPPPPRHIRPNVGPVQQSSGYRVRRFPLVGTWMRVWNPETQYIYLITERIAGSESGGRRRMGLNSSTKDA